MAITQEMAKAAVDSQAKESVIPYQAYRDLVMQLEQLVTNTGRIEIVKNDDGTIDVRSGGIAAYGRTLFVAARTRVEVEAARVTDRLMAGQTAIGVISAAHGYVSKP